MKTRQEIKAQAKSIIGGNYSGALLPGLLYLLIAAVASGVTFGLGFIITLPLVVGMTLVYINLWRGEASTIDVMFSSAFQENFGRKLGGMLWMALFEWLWSMLFVIPGIVKSYSYAMTPYILAKYPNVPAQEALKLSMRIMNGRKLDLFVVDLSFIGWYLLSGLTFGLLAIFYVNPYVYLTKAGCFNEYLNDALSRNIIDMSELRVNG